MKAIIQQVNSYNITIKGKLHSNFKMISQWEGMVKFEGPDGELIVFEAGSFKQNFFTEIFGAPSPASKPVEFDIVNASVNLVPNE